MNLVKPIQAYYWAALALTVLVLLPMIAVRYSLDYESAATKSFGACGSTRHTLSSWNNWERFQFIREALAQSPKNNYKREALIERSRSPLYAPLSNQSFVVDEKGAPVERSGIKLVGASRIDSDGGCVFCYKGAYYPHVGDPIYSLCGVGGGLALWIDGAIGAYEWNVQLKSASPNADAAYRPLSSEILRVDEFSRLPSRILGPRSINLLMIPAVPASLLPLHVELSSRNGDYHEWTIKRVPVASRLILPIAHLNTTVAGVVLSLSARGDQISFRAQPTSGISCDEVGISGLKLIPEYGAACYRPENAEVLESAPVAPLADQSGLSISTPRNASRMKWIETKGRFTRYRTIYETILIPQIEIVNTPSGKLQFSTIPSRGISVTTPHGVHLDLLPDERAETLIQRSSFYHGGEHWWKHGSGWWERTQMKINADRVMSFTPAALRGLSIERQPPDVEVVGFVADGVDGISLVHRFFMNAELPRNKSEYGVVIPNCGYELTELKNVSITIAERVPIAVGTFDLTAPIIRDRQRRLLLAPR